MRDRSNAGTEACTQANTETATSDSGQGTTNTGSGGPTTPEGMSIEDLKFDCLRNALYHSARQTFYDAIHRWLMFVVVVSGSGAVALYGQNHATFGAISSLLAAASGAVDLVFGVGSKARLHENLRRRYYEILAQIERVEPSAELMRDWNAEVFLIYADEPPQMRALDAVAYNTAADSLYGDDRKRVEVGFVKRMLKQFLPFNGAKFSYRTP